MTEFFAIYSYRSGSPKGDVRPVKDAITGSRRFIPALEH